MKFYNIIYQNLRSAGLLLLCILLTDTISAQTQKEKKARQMVDVIIKVVDENGTPFPNAQVVIGEGVIHAVTDENGSLSFKAYLNDFVSVSSSGYGKGVSLVEDLIEDSTIKLIKSKLFMTPSDNIHVPFATIKKRNMTGATTVIDGKKLEMYPTSDLRNALTGLATGVEVIEISGEPGISTQENLGSFGATEKINITSRGRNMVFMIDNIPTNITELPLDPDEIESVSVIKDIAGKAMFGPYCADGIILITTKRGVKNEKMSNINFERGVSWIDRMPEWVSGSEYATLNNQARINDLLDPNYTNNDISAYAQDDPYDKFHPSINFKDLMLKNDKSLTRVNVSSSGGSDIVQYYAYVGYTGEGDNYRIGDKADYNKVAVRSNIDIKINDQLGVSCDFYGNLTIRRSPTYVLSTSESTSTTKLIAMPTVLSDITSIPPIAFPILASYDSVNNVPWYGVSQAYEENPIGNLTDRGYYIETGRMGAANIALNYDMSHLIQGLKSKTNIHFNNFNLVRLGKVENYIAYIATPSESPVTGRDTILFQLKHLGTSMTNQARLMDYYFHRFAIYENLTYNRTFGKSALNSSLTYYLARTARDGIEEPERQQNGILTSTYTYDDKYSILGVLNYAGTTIFSEDNRYGLFPSVGASWVISEETFFSGIKFINFLKLRGQAGILGYQTVMSPYLYLDSWSTNNTGSAFGPRSTNTWFGTSTDASVPRSSISRLGNIDLSWEKAKEISLGLDALLFNEKLLFDITWYNNVRDGQIDRIDNDLPLMLGLGTAMPYYNFGKIRYFGLETGLLFTDKSSDFFYSIGASGTIQNSERLVYDEPNYRPGSEYQSRVGKPVDAYFGMTCLGKFTTDAEALEVPQLFDAVLLAGDLKYADLNNDGFIDDNDQNMIGHTTPRFFYSVMSKFSYKNVELAILGTGRAFYDIALTNNYFWNGWGDNTYSAFVRDNIGGAYPRLTYYKVNNNFVASDFWLEKGNHFKIQNIELAYNLPNRVANLIGGRLIRVYVRGANFLTISKLKDVDPESISSGVSAYPLFKTYTGGIKFNF